MTHLKRLRLYTQKANPKANENNLTRNGATEKSLAKAEAFSNLEEELLKEKSINKQTRIDWKRLMRN